MKYPVSEIVKIFDNAEVQGDASVELSGIASLDKATESDLSFLGNKNIRQMFQQQKLVPYYYLVHTMELFLRNLQLYWLIIHRQNWQSWVKL